MTTTTNNSALLVLDMNREYIYGEKPLIPVESRVNLISNIKKVIKYFRTKNAPIIYITSAFSNADPIYHLINYRSQAVEGSDNGETIDELKPQPQDLVLKKRGFDGFWKSGLQELLKELNTKKLYLTGCQTDCCVRETAVTASHLNYDVYILEDCCQTSREFGQVAALRFFTCCTKGVINSKSLASHF